MLFNSFLDLLSKGGYTIFILLFCSILSLKVVIEKAIVFQGLKEKNLDDLRNKVMASLSSNDIKEAL
ncbi:MAG: hypothetical protein ACM34K_08465, partial [Bacillota bacterium]